MIKIKENIVLNTIGIAVCKKRRIWNFSFLIRREVLRKGKIMKVISPTRRCRRTGTINILLIIVFFCLNFALSNPSQVKADPGKAWLNGKPIICTDIANDICYSCSGEEINIKGVQTTAGDFKCPKPPPAPTSLPVKNKDAILGDPKQGVIPADKKAQ